MTVKSTLSTRSPAAVVPVVRRFAWVLIVVGCGSDPQAASPCPEGQQREGAMCAPRFDACPEGELPKLGGGCMAVGVPRDAGCASGLESDGRGSCKATIPGCAPGTVAVPGDAACRPIAACPTERWADVPAGAIFVDAAFSGSGDGTRERPFPTLGAALAGAPTGATIAVTAGRYVESLSLDRAVTILGECPARVVIEGSDPASPAIAIRADATLRGVSVRGPSGGIAIDRSIKVTLERLHVHDTAREGVRVDSVRGVPTVSIADSLIEDVAYAGVRVIGAAATIERTVIRDVAPDTTRPQPLGCAVLAEHHPVDGRRAEVTVRGSLLERATELGVGALGAVLRLDGSVLRDTRPNRAGMRGHGLLVQNDAAIAAEVTVVGSVLERSSDLGASVLGPAKLTIERSVIRETLPRKKGGLFGTGLQIEAGEVSIVDSAIEGNRYAGVSIKSGTLEVTRSIIRDTDGQASDGAFGIGVAVSIMGVGGAPSRATLRDAIVARNRVAGVTSVVSELSIERCAIVDTTAQVSDGRFGDGLVVHSWFDLSAAEARGSATIRDSFVARNARAGVSSFAATLTLGRSALRCNGLDFDVEHVKDLTFDIVDLGHNACGCGAAETCKAQSTSLEPVQAP